MNARLPLKALNSANALTHVTNAWDDEITSRLTDYIAIPAKSPGFDADWAAHGYLDTVVQNAFEWVRAQKVEGLQIEIVRLKKADGKARTPVLFFDIAAHQSTSQQTVLMYGHLDKQPEFEGWRNDLCLGHPSWKPPKTAANACTAEAVLTTAMPCTQP